MFLPLLIKEIHEAIVSLRFIVAAGLCLVLLPLGMGISYQDYTCRVREYDQARQLCRENSEKQYKSSFYRAEGYRRPAPLSFLAGGLEPVLPTKVLTAKNGNFSLMSDSNIDDPDKILTGGLDLVFIMTLVLSLLAFIMTFGTVAGEKEQGTARLLLSYSVSRAQVLVSKILGGYLVFLFPFLSVFVLSLLGIGFLGGGEIFTGDLPQRIAAILAISLVFSLGMFCLGTFVSIRAGRSSTAMISLLLIWILFILVIPKAGPLAANAIVPAVPRYVVTERIDRLDFSLQSEMRKEIRNTAERLLAREGYAGVHIREVPQEVQSRLTEGFQREVAALENRYRTKAAREEKNTREAYTARLAERSRISLAFLRLSPASCVTLASSEFAGTGIGEIRNLFDHAERFQKVVEQKIYSKETTEYHLGGAGVMNDVKQDEPAPQLDGYRLPGLSGTVMAALPDMVLLALDAAVFFTLALVSFLRYDPR